jgi:hypothetical protein
MRGLTIGFDRSFEMVGFKGSDFFRVRLIFERFDFYEVLWTWFSSFFFYR